MNDTHNAPSIRRQIHIALVVLFLTVITVAVMFTRKTELPVAATSALPPLVNTQRVQTETLRIPIQARALIEPQKQITLLSQVIGTVIYINEHFVAGGHFKKGDILLKADTTYLNMELQKAKAAYHQAVFHELEVRAEIEAGSNDNNAQSELAQGKPQLAVASSAREAALAAMQLAQQQLDNAVLRAPFDGRVITRTIQEQDALIIGRPIGQIYATEKLQAKIPLTQEQLQLLGNIHNSKLGIILSNDNHSRQWQGRLLRSESLIAANRMVTVIGEIDSPDDELLLGSLMHITINSEPKTAISAIPIQALREANTVWLVDAQSRVHIQKVAVLHQTNETAFISTGLKTGDIIVVSGLNNVYDNMAVNVSNSTASPAP